MNYFVLVTTFLIAEKFINGSFLSKSGPEGIIDIDSDEFPPNMTKSTIGPTEPGPGTFPRPTVEGLLIKNGRILGKNESDVNDPTLGYRRISHSMDMWEETCLDYLVTWWKAMSKPEGIKCNQSMRNALNLDMSPLTGSANPYIVAKACDKNETATVPFQFKDLNISKDGSLNGTGILILQNEEFSTSPLRFICIRIHPPKFEEPEQDLLLNFHQPIQTIKGTFFDGVLEGEATVTFASKNDKDRKFIGTFVHGVLHGLVREFKKQKLTAIRYIANGHFNIGFGWLNTGHGHLLFSDFDGLSSLSLLVAPSEIHNNTPVFMSGIRFPHTSSLEYLRPAKIMGLNNMSCILGFQWTPVGEWLPFRHHIALGGNSPLKRKENGFCPTVGGLHLPNWMGKWQTWTEGRYYDLLWKLPLEMSLPKYNAKPLISPMLTQDHERKLWIAIFGQTQRISHFYADMFDFRTGKLNGMARITLWGNDSTKPPPTDPLMGWTVTGLEAYFYDGYIQDVVKIYDGISGRIIFAQTVNNVLHGPLIVNGITPIMPFPIPLDRGHKPGLGFVGRYRDGVPWGPFWTQLVGSGMLHGENGSLSGELAFVYPDYETAIVGAFENTVLKKGQQVDLEGMKRCEEGIPVAKFSQPRGPILKFDPPHKANWSRQLDPYEHKWLQMHPTGVGVTVKRKVPLHRRLGLFVGNMEILNLTTQGEENQKKDGEVKCTKLDGEVCLERTISFTLNWTKNVEIVVTSLPLLGNHTFFGSQVEHGYGANSKYSLMESPLYGLLPALETIHEINSGDELIAIGKALWMTDTNSQDTTSWKRLA